MHVVSFTSLARGEGGIVGHLLHALRHDGGRQVPRRRAHSKHVAISVAGTRVDAGMFDHGHLAKLRLGEQSYHRLEGRERQDSGFAVTTASPCCRSPPTWIICATPPRLKPFQQRDLATFQVSVRRDMGRLGPLRRPGDLFKSHGVEERGGDV